MSAPPLPDGFVVVVKRECETCRMVVPVLRQLAEAGDLTVYTQDDPDFPGDPRAVLDDGLALSWHHSIETVPTLMRVRDGVEVERTIGWLRRELGGAHGHLRARPGPARRSARMRFDERRPGSRRRAARAPRRQRAAVAADRGRRRRGRARDDVHPGMVGRAAGRAADRAACDGDADRHDAGARRDRRDSAAGSRRRHRREGGDRGGDGGLQAGVPAVGADGRRGGLHRRVQHARRAGHDDAGRAGAGVQRSGNAGDRHGLGRERARAGQPRQLDDRAGAATRRAQRRWRPSRRGRPRDARQPGQARILLRRERRRLAVRDARRPARRRCRHGRRDGLRRRGPAMRRRSAVAHAGEPGRVARRAAQGAAPPQARAGVRRHPGDGSRARPRVRRGGLGPRPHHHRAARPAHDTGRRARARCGRHRRRHPGRVRRRWRSRSSRPTA